MVLGLRLGLPKQEVYAINTLGEIEDMLSAAAPGLGGKGPLPAVEVSVLAALEKASRQVSFGGAPEVPTLAPRLQTLSVCACLPDIGEQRPTS